MIGGRLFILLLAAAAGSCGAQPNAAETGGALADSSRSEPLTADPIKRTFEEWLLACDNGRVCRAQPRDSAGSLMIRRDPGPGGLVRVVLDGQEPGEPLRPNPATIRLAGVPDAPAAPWRLDAEADRATLEGQPAIAFVRALSRASALSYETTEGRLEVPLAGMRAALAVMDAEQGHAGGEAAFVRVGAQPRAALPAAPALPVVRVAAAAPLPALPDGFAARVRRESREVFDDCEVEPPQEDQVYPLTAEDVLMIAECSRGLTHVSYRLLTVPREDPARAQLVLLPTIDEMDDAYEDGSATYVDLEWDPATRQLYSNYRSCMGACGDNVAWVFDGTQFQLLGYAFYQGGGAESLDLYRADVRRPR